jgi:hypothetical protein
MTAVYRQKRFRRKRDRALEFSLYELIKIAAELQWLPRKRITWAGKRADIAGFTHEVRKVRNLVHPGQWANRHWNAMKITKRMYGVTYEVFDVASSWLLQGVERDLLKAMKRKERRSKRLPAP